MHRGLLIAGLTLAFAMPLGLAAQSPLLAWRDPIYITAGFAGIAAMALIPLQIALGAGWFGPSRKLHRVVGAALLALIAAHVSGLWITSPPDVIDAMLLRSPTPFSVFGVAAMWALIATAGLAHQRRRLRFATWRRWHLILGGMIVGGTVIHAAQIEGTMETISKFALSAGLIGAFGLLVAGHIMQKGRGTPRP